MLLNFLGSGVLLCTMKVPPAQSLHRLFGCSGSCLALRGRGLGLGQPSSPVFLEDQAVASLRGIM